MDIRLSLGVLGSVLLVGGVLTSGDRKNTLFAAGNVCMFGYAYLGYIGGGPIFFLILQLFIGLSTVCMLLRVPDAIDTTILAVGGTALVGWSLTLFEGYSTAIFVVGLVLLGIGFAMDTGTQRREIALMTGSAVIAIFSVLMRDVIFIILNALFALLSLVNVLRSVRHTRQTPIPVK